MSKKEKILFVHLTHYGKHTNSYKYCQYLKDQYDITYLCFDQNFQKIEDETTVIYLKGTGSSILNTFKIIGFARELISQEEYHIVYIFYFMLSSWIKPFLATNFILDIRTGAIDKKWFKREKFNFLLRMESKLFKKVTVISESLRKKLKLDAKRCVIMPLGSDIISSKEKSYDNLHLLYIGTLSQRDIDQTVHGLSKFVQAYNEEDIEITYDIFGDGLDADVTALQDAIVETKLSDIVHYHGRKEHHEIVDYFEKCNVGVSYIPMQDYFDCQPPTKTFEYVNSGMVCLATATSENRLLINKENGLVFEDNRDAFYRVLIQFYNKRKVYHTEKIIGSLTEYTWKNIVEKRVKPLLQSF